MIESVKEQFVEHVKSLQDEITKTMLDIDSELQLTEDLWDRKDFEGNPGGGGRTRAFEGRIFENAGVNFSEVYGVVPPEFASKIGGNGNTMWASGISLIIHPKNPRVPTVHANFRLVQAGDKYWFGGGADLTPYYPHTEDFSYFHNVWRQACDSYGTYEKWKKTCDEYFTNHHRDDEMRGIGGIFYDHLNSGDLEKDFSMVKDVSNFFIESYFPLVHKRKDEKYTDADEDFQLHRHGRYVEFNLIHDRGTMFGLQSKGRVDSILISLPKRCKWSYAYKPAAGSVHEEMMKYYKPKVW